MFFSRILIAAVAVVGVITAPSNTPGSLQHDSINVIGHAHHGRDTAPYAVAKPKFEALQDQVADAMAGPQAEREAKLVAITGSLLDTVKQYNSGFKSRWTAQSLYPQMGQKAEEVKNVGSFVYHILRSCKGTRSATLAANIAAIDTEIDDFGNTLAKMMAGDAPTILAGFDKFSQRLEAIHAAVAA